MRRSPMSRQARRNDSLARNPPYVQAAGPNPAGPEGTGSRRAADLVFKFLLRPRDPQGQEPPLRHALLGPLNQLLLAEHQDAATAEPAGLATRHQDMTVGLADDDGMGIGRRRDVLDPFIGLGIQEGDR